MLLLFSLLTSLTGSVPQGFDSCRVKEKANKHQTATKIQPRNIIISSRNKQLPVENTELKLASKMSLLKVNKNFSNQTANNTVTCMSASGICKEYYFTVAMTSFSGRFALLTGCLEHIFPSSVLQPGLTGTLTSLNEQCGWSYLVLTMSEKLRWTFWLLITKMLKAEKFRFVTVSLSLRKCYLLLWKFGIFWVLESFSLSQWLDI